MKEGRARRSAERRLEQVDSALEQRVRKRTRELHALVDSLAQQASHDDLTGLWNRRHLNELLRMEIARSRRSGADISMLLIDVDGLKSLNDNEGHHAGDRALVRVPRSSRKRFAPATCSPAGVATSSRPCCPTTKIDDAHLVAERLRRAVNRSGSGAGCVTVSIGVAEWYDESPEELMRRCDVGLYEAKRQGRNAVVRVGPARTEGHLPRQRQRGSDSARSRRFVGPHAVVAPLRDESERSA